ncbi:DUF1330 domain-containing protein [Microtetraspora malaysiensis]|uniref:DUF1330 domain-containing protein n=1 Tax=Microtetraspora malaysiensis TaxID=161358 RepID=UPI003D905F4D
MREGFSGSCATVSQAPRHVLPNSRRRFTFRVSHGSTPAGYIERLPTTFAPYGGRYLVHATQHEVKEGDRPGH